MRPGQDTCGPTVEVQQLQAWRVPHHLFSIHNQEPGLADAKVRGQPLSRRQGRTHPQWPPRGPQERVCSATAP